MNDTTRSALTDEQSAADLVGTSRPLTFGEKAVGLDQPTLNRAVVECKVHFAILIDQLDAERLAAGRSEQARLASVAITELQGAQMWAVKALTWKD